MTEKISAADKRKYVLPKKRDFEILLKCKVLKKRKLSKQDAASVKLIKTQLENDWRTPLLKELNRILLKYKD